MLTAMRLIAASLALIAVATPLAAQERAPPERQNLLELAYVIGESHALRQACLGPDDQYWRQRMLRMADVEAADQNFDAQMRDRFNTGFAAGQAQHPGCDRETRRAAVASATKGRLIAGRMAVVVRRTDPVETPPTP